MTALDLREVARAQNDRDHAAGLLPSRYVEDEVTLQRVAALLQAQASKEGGAHVRKAS
jgi:hypothetical protein